MGLFDRSAEAIRTGLRERVFEPRALREAERKSPEIAAAVGAGAPPAGGGRSEAGEAVVAGVFALDGWTVRCRPEALWRQRPPSAAWARAAHGFGWLADLDALGGRAAAETAATLIAGWLERRKRYETLVWDTDVTARRLWALLDAEALGPGLAADPQLGPRLLKSLGAHVLWLERRWADAPAGMVALRAAAATTRASLDLDGLTAHRARAKERLEAAIVNGLHPDGGPISRNPEDALETLEKLQVLRERFDAGLPEDVPEALRGALPQVAQAVRFFRRSDGGLPLFHGARAADDGRVDAALTRARRGEAAPHGLAQTGYLRFSGGRVSAVFDVGGAGEDASQPQVASPLAIELSTGRRRLIVNCGSAAHLDPAWAAACRSVGARSTLSLPLEPDERAAFAPGPVASDRRTERNGEWLYGAHDGYAALLGVQLSRRMFLTADGGDFRGEDVVETHRDGGRALEKRLARLPRAERAAGLPFTARFHLHPDVEAELVADGEAVALRLPHGENWVMRQAGGRIALAPSVYLDRPGPPRQTIQIVATGRFTGERAHLRWAFRRVGDLAQQPRDVDALLAAVRVEEMDPTEAAGSVASDLGAPPVFD